MSGHLRVLFGLVVGLCALLGGFSEDAFAHRPSDAFVRLESEGERISATVEVSLRDLDYVLGIDADANGELTWGELKAARAVFEQYVLPRLSLVQQEASCTWTPKELKASRHGEDGYAVLTLDGRCPKPIVSAAAQLSYRLLIDVDPSHKALVTVAASGSQHLTVASIEAPTVLITGVATNQVVEFFGEGVLHILLGYDHFLFLVALLLPAVLIREGFSWRPVSDLRSAVIGILKVVTAFTVAHSITLTLGAVGLITIPSRIVEAAVAASVFFAALNNLLPIVGEHRAWRMAFVFGLLHGFGFAGILAEGGATGMSFVKCLLGFNLGVEAGQVMIVLSFIPIAFTMRATKFYRWAVVGVGSFAVLLLSGAWFLQRIAGL